jgi:hypothetical protein
LLSYSERRISKYRHKMQIYTTTLTSGVLALNREDGAIVISIQSKTGGEALFTGNLPFKGVTPTPITLTAGQVFNYSAASPSSPLDGITITWVAGDIDIVVGF